MSLPRVSAPPGAPGVPRPLQDTLSAPPLAVRDPVGHEHPHEEGELRPRQRRSGEVLPEEVRAVDDDEPAEAPGIMRAEAELPVLDDDLRCVADPAEPGEAVREVLVLGERVPAHELVEANGHRGFPARAHEAALHELDVARLVDIPEVAGIAVSGEGSLPAPAEQKAAEWRERSEAAVVLGLDDLAGRADHAPVVVGFS